MARGTDIGQVMASLERLERAVGDGDLSMSITMNQRYAKFQHERMDLKHPHGGKHHFLTDPLFDHVRQILGALAMAAVTARGSALRAAMVHQVEAWAVRSVAQTPIWWGDLPNSHAPEVVDDGEIVYRRPPKARRLTDEELKLKNRWHPHPSSWGGERR